MHYQDSTRLNYLAYIETLESSNKHVKNDICELDFRLFEKYAYIQFVCIYPFKKDQNMLLYSFYYYAKVVDSLVYDIEFKCRR